jgi:Flp pilus assembly protein TadG
MGAATRWRRADGGNAAVEFALLAPLLAALIVGVVTIGTEIHFRLVLRDAVRAGVQAAMGGERDVSRMAEIVSQAASDRDLSAQATVTMNCTCGGVTISCVQNVCAAGNLPTVRVRVQASSSSAGVSVADEVRVQ